jgi:hypothetical protein
MAWDERRVPRVDSFWQLRSALEPLDQLLAEPEIAGFVRWFLESPAEPGVRTTTYESLSWADGASFVLTDALTSLADYLDQGGPLELSESTLRQSWDDRAALSSAPPFHSMFLISGFELSDPVDLGVFGSLEPLDDGTKTDRFRYHHWSFGAASEDEVAASTVAWRYKHGPLQLPRIVRVVMTALRLMLGSQIFGKGMIGCMATDRLPFGYVRSRIFDFEPPPSDRGIPAHTVGAYQMTPDRTAHLLVLCNALQNHALDMFPLAFRRFNQAMRRSLVEDRVVDLAIVLESVVLAGKTGELDWRGQVFGTELLRGRLPTADARRRLKALYSSRSTIVHEGVELAQELPRKKDWKIVAADVDTFDRSLVELIQLLLLEAVKRSETLASAKDLPKQLEEAVFAERVP